MASWKDVGHQITVPSGGTSPPPPLVPLLWLEKIAGSACPTEADEYDAKRVDAGDNEEELCVGSQGMGRRIPFVASLYAVTSPKTNTDTTDKMLVKRSASILRKKQMGETAIM